MNNIRLFYQENLSNNLTGKLDKKQSHYIFKVMRIKENENFNIFNGFGEWLAKVNKISKGIVEFKIIKQLRAKENSREIWLAFSPIKSNYFNFMIQKATELGVTKLIPLIFERTVVRKINKERLSKIDQIKSGKFDKVDNPIKNAPHTDSELASDKWTHKYTREEAAYPAKFLRANKFWPPVARVDNVYGDKNIFCTCPSMDEFKEDAA